MHRRGHGHISYSGFRRFDMRHDVQRGRIPGVGQMHVVASPGPAPLIADVGLGVIGRIHPHPSWRQVRSLAQPHLPVGIGLILVHPGLSKDFHGWDVPQPTGCCGMIQSMEEV
jgi:hypothetical protein